MIILTLGIKYKNRMGRLVANTHARRKSRTYCSTDIITLTDKPEKVLQDMRLWTQ